jgi:endonuclease-3
VSADEALHLLSLYEALSQRYPTFDKTDDPWMTNGLSSTPFRCLVSVCLSTMTITPRVVKACVPLFARVSTFEELLALEDEELRALIKPVAHYNRKTTQLKVMCRQVLEEFGGRIPDTHEDLMKLQGVGRKVADIMMNFIFNQDTIAVDTHVLRVLNRLGIVKTSVPELASDQINAKTPALYKRHAHEWLIQHGMQVCTARKPRCDACCVAPLCPHPRTA